MNGLSFTSFCFADFTCRQHFSCCVCACVRYFLRNVCYRTAKNLGKISPVKIFAIEWCKFCFSFRDRVLKYEGNKFETLATISRKWRALAKKCAATSIDFISPSVVTIENVILPGRVLHFQGQPFSCYSFAITNCTKTADVSGRFVSTRLTSSRRCFC